MKVRHSIKEATPRSDKGGGAGQGDRIEVERSGPTLLLQLCLRLWLNRNTKVTILAELADARNAGPSGCVLFQHKRSVNMSYNSRYLMTSGLNSLFPQFGTNFMRHHAGSIILDTRFAITELVANAWDAGATVVEISWPDGPGEIVIRDNGTGMTRAEFEERWSILNYNRLERQGSDIEFPPSVKGNKNRKVFGRNGIGRHAMFHFGHTYTVSTAKNGQRTTAEVKPADNQAFQINVISVEPSDKHGTELRADVVSKPNLDEKTVANLLGSKFIYDPSFRIIVNSTEVKFQDLSQASPSFTVDTPYGVVTVYRFDAQYGRTSDQSGVAWWVKDRLVGSRSWLIGGNPLIDARSSAGKRLVYVVIADQLESVVKPDWSGFYSSDKLNAIECAVEDRLRSDIHEYLIATRRDRKRGVIARSRDSLRKLSPISQYQIAQFIDDVQRESPTINERDLSNIVSILANLELSNTGYSLLEKLAVLSPDDLDGLDEILAEWSIDDAKIVLNELGRRIKLIEKLQNLVNAAQADELHELQPLFERGLWIFGPQFESISFTSNRTLSTVVRKYFASRDGLRVEDLTTPKKRPDFVALPNSSIGVYSADGFGTDHEVDEIGYVMIVELKRGGFEISGDEMDQAQHYARELRKAGLSNNTNITCYVLGSSVASGTEEVDIGRGKTNIIAKSYSVVLRQAHNRTFRLKDKIASRIPTYEDQDMRDIVANDLFNENIN